MVLKKKKKLRKVEGLRMPMKSEESTRNRNRRIEIEASSARLQRPEWKDSY